MAKIGLELYSLRDLVAEKDLPEAIKTAADLGFDGVEFAGYFGHSAKELKALLADLGMEAAGTHTQFKELTGDLSAVIDYNLELGQKYVVCPSLPHEMLADYDNCLQTADILNSIGEKVAESGMIFGYHNHSFEFEKVNGQFAYDVLFSHVDPRYVKMQLDTCWVENVNLKSIDYMKRYPEHFELLHIKELAAPGKGHDRAVIGQGCIDFKSICDLAQEMNCAWYTIEHECTEGDVIDDIRQGINHMKTILK